MARTSRTKKESTSSSSRDEKLQLLKDTSVRLIEVEDKMTALAIEKQSLESKIFNLKNELGFHLGLVSRYGYPMDMSFLDPVPNFKRKPFGPETTENNN